MDFIPVKYYICHIGSKLIYKHPLRHHDKTHAVHFDIIFVDKHYISRANQNVSVYLIRYVKMHNGKVDVKQIFLGCSY